ncbi:siderophore biosynthesis protein [Cronbergia sp. UHCC 0137]|uniref:siderophore biosynthesis protein n=1 Tax=Cronbergia sp. UHCC 0137 TaxID=3110239 RepID=UPI002B220325|nr:siderophore biosynthesis protein [Cronbergia sp. UHCC 0137]MEA5617536.1 siderophore biosynthesis protein [Cronbergia sp. UHCC 0137]
MLKIAAQEIWQGFHWSFFINIQGLIICLRRFELELKDGNLQQARTELETATQLMLASGAAMQLAGSMSPELYEAEIRPSMMPPHVKSHDFSGLMSWEHSVLIKVWKQLRPHFANLPIELKDQHQGFVDAYLYLASSHRAVCQKFGGEEAGSLRFERSCAVDILDAFARSRCQFINPESLEECLTQRRSEPAL